jgi:hypothetical protein
MERTVICGDSKCVLVQSVKYGISAGDRALPHGSDFAVSASASSENELMYDMRNTFNGLAGIDELCRSPNNSPNCALGISAVTEATRRILSLKYVVSRYATTALGGRLPAQMFP